MCLLATSLGACDLDRPGEGNARLWASALSPSATNGQTHASHWQRFESSRPKGVEFTLSSRFFPARVMALQGTSVVQAQAALAMWEDVYRRWRDKGWPLPIPDSFKGEGPAMDLYLMDSPGHCAQSQVDTMESHHGFDSALGYSVVSIRQPKPVMQGCVYEAFARLALLRYAPHVDPKWHGMSAAYLAWQLTGSPDYFEQLGSPSAYPWQTPFTSDTKGDRGVFLWSLIEQKKAAPLGQYLWQMWQSTRVATQSHSDLADAEDLWEMLRLELEASKQTFPIFYADLGLDWATTKPHGTVSQTTVLPPPTGPIMRRTIKSSDLPDREKWIDPPVEALGRIYYRIVLEPIHRGQAIRVWLKPEYGVRWILSAARHDANGQEISRIHTPERKDTPLYLHVETTPQTSSVVVMVTNLSWRAPDAHYDDNSTRSFSIVFDRQRSP